MTLTSTLTHFPSVREVRFEVSSRRGSEECIIISEDDDSPYPEVRSAVANTDDPDMPVNTIRAWAIGIIWSIILPGMNQFFFFRLPGVTVTGVSSVFPARPSHELMYPS